MHKTLEWFRSNLEVFLIAFIMAMLIRCFTVEVFKIPTGSMEPTLHGSYTDGDRIIANKFKYYYSKPDRFDVALFKFPLDKTKNFVKRIVGLPDEELMIKEGNIYYRPKEQDKTAVSPALMRDKFLIAKKPLDVQESIWIDVFDWKTNGGTFEALAAKWEMPDRQKTDYLADNGMLTIGPKPALQTLTGSQSENPERAEFVYHETIKDKYPNDGGGRNNVQDIKFAFRCRMTDENSVISAKLKSVFEQSGINEFTVRLAPVKPTATEVGNAFEHKTASPASVKTIPLKFDFALNKDYLVEFMNFDGSVYITVDDKVILKYDYANFLGDISFGRAIPVEQVSLDTTGNGIVISDLKISRDIYYASNYNGRGTFEEGKPELVPPGKYVVMGDNVPNSKDSRLWIIKRILLKNGTVIESDNEPEYFSDDGKFLRIRHDEVKNRGGDIWGIPHTIKKEDILDIKDEYYKFIDADEIFGKAVMVYWPPKRWKFIR